MFSFRGLWLSALLTCIGCQYDFNELYVIPDGGAGDGGGNGDGNYSSHLIGAWRDYPVVDAECVQCAETSCAAAEDACLGDPECVSFTRCIGETPNPAGQMVCRDRHLDWMTNEQFYAHDNNGPYGQCVFRDSCARECEGTQDFACLHNYSWPLTSALTVPLSLLLNDSGDLTKSVPGVTAKVCPDGDVMCKTPSAMGVSDERGLIKLDLPTTFNRSFTGFIELTREGVYPTLLKFSWQPGGPTMQVVTMINKEQFDFYTNNLLSFPLDPARGTLQTRMFGCSMQTTRGVKYAIANADSKTTLWYMDNGIPSITATETSSLGAGGAFNVATGYQTVTAMRASDGEVVGHAYAPIRPGYMTVVVFVPDAE